MRRGMGLGFRKGGRRARNCDLLIHLFVLWLLGPCHVVGVAEVKILAFSIYHMNVH